MRGGVWERRSFNKCDSYNCDFNSPSLPLLIPEHRTCDTLIFQFRCTGTKFVAKLLVIIVRMIGDWLLWPTFRYTI